MAFVVFKKTTKRFMRNVQNSPQFDSLTDRGDQTSATTA